MRGKSKKVIKTENFVDEYIAKYGFPPTYRQIEDFFGLSVSAAYSRCTKFRYKMVQNETVKTRGGATRVKIDFYVPLDKLARFGALYEKMVTLLKT